MVWALVAALPGVCGGPTINTTTKLPPQVRPVVRDATRDELLDKYNEIARAVKSVNATVELKPTAGSKYSGIIEKYHEVKAFILARRPAQNHDIVQAPHVGHTLFYMSNVSVT